MQDASSTRNSFNDDVLPPGTTLLGGAFELHEVLGRGGFGISYRATNRRRERDVAIKELFTLGCKRDHKNVVAEGENALLFQQARARFQEQARDLAPLRHSNIVRVYELIEENNTLYLIMELLRGQTLLRMVESCGALSESEALITIHKVGGALTAVHNLGLLHLDVKPENVWRTSDGRVILMDFDLVQKRPRGHDFQTRPLNETFRSGTPGYAPLEQYSNVAPFSPATDIYALGATLFHLVVGNAPPSPLESANDDAPMIPTSLSENVRETLRRALQPLPKNRPQNVRDFLDLLDGRAAESLARTSSTRSPTSVLTPTNSNSNVTSSPNTNSPNTGSYASSQNVLAQNTAAHNALMRGVTPQNAVAQNANPSNANPRNTTSRSTNSQNAAHQNAVFGASNAVAASAIDENLKGRVWRVAIEEIYLRDLKWPSLCPCCGQSCAVNSMNFFEIGKGARSWKVPHCAECAVHTDGTRTAVFVTIWGMVGGTLISIVGLAMKSLLMGPFGIVVYFSAASYGALKTADADSRTKRECADKKIAVSYLGARFKNGRNLVVFEFRRPDYAESFRQTNNAVWG